MGYVREKEKVVRMAMRAFSRHLMDDTRMAFGFSGSHDFIHATASCCGKTLVDASSILNQHLTSSIHTLRKFKAENNSRINEMEERLADETIQICQEAVRTCTGLGCSVLLTVSFLSFWQIALGLKAHVVVKVDMTVGQNFFELVSRVGMLQSFGCSLV